MKLKSQLIASGIIALFMTTTSFAQTEQPRELMKPHEAKMMNLCFKHPHRYQRMHKLHFNNFARSWRIALDHHKQLTESDAKTVAQAALILYGSNDMKVGAVTPIAKNDARQNFKVEILKDDKVFTTLEMNGHNGRIER